MEFVNSNVDECKLGSVGYKMKFVNPNLDEMEFETCKQFGFVNSNLECKLKSVECKFVFVNSKF